MRNDDGRRLIHEQGSDGGPVSDGGGDRGIGETAERTPAADGQVRQPVLGFPEREPNLTGTKRYAMKGVSETAFYYIAQQPCLRYIQRIASIIMEGWE